MRLLDAANDAHVVRVMRRGERFAPLSANVAVEGLGKNLLAIRRRVDRFKQRKALAGSEVLEMDPVDGCAFWAGFSPHNFYRRANLLAARGRDLRNTVGPNGEIRARRQTHAAGAHIRG